MSVDENIPDEPIDVNSSYPNVPDDMTREQYKMKINSEYGRYANTDSVKVNGFWRGARKTWVAFIGVFAASASVAVVEITNDGAVTADEVIRPLIIATGLGLAAAFAVWRVPNAE